MHRRFSSGMAPAPDTRRITGGSGRMRSRGWTAIQGLDFAGCISIASPRRCLGAILKEQDG